MPVDERSEARGGEPLRRYKELGILGGLGPAATAYLFSKVVERTDAECDRDHLDVTVLSRPRIPDRTAYLLGQSDVDFAPALVRAAERLADAGCGVIVIGCVTAHAAIGRVRDAVRGRAQVLDLPSEIADDLARRGCRRAGLLATDGTLRTRVVQDALEARGIEVLTPDAEHQAVVMEIIYKQVKAGRPADVEAFKRICRHFADQGCESVVLGCTELPLIGVGAECAGMHVADSLDILARAAVLACGARVRG